MIELSGFIPGGEHEEYCLQIPSLGQRRTASLALEIAAHILVRQAALWLGSATGIQDVGFQRASILKLRDRNIQAFVSTFHPRISKGFAGQ